MGLPVFLAFYRSEFLHGLFPMAEIGKWVRNGLLLLAFGMEAAGGIGKRQQTTQVILFTLTASCFASSVGADWRDIICEVAFLVVIAVDVWGVYGLRWEMGLCGETGQNGKA